jgi:phage FluMu protein Com
MFSGVIRCNHCGNEAVAEILGIVTTGPAAGNQRYFGYNQSTGYLTFRCPACSTELAINPAEVLISRFLQGLPELSGILALQARKTA